VEAATGERAIGAGVTVPHLLIRAYYTCFNERRFANGADLVAEDGVLEHPHSSVIFDLNDLIRQLSGTGDV
jgi:hypothetical protein